MDVLKGLHNWRETNGDDWDVAFGECYGGSAEYRHLRSNQKIMEFPDLDMIWDKARACFRSTCPNPNPNPNLKLPLP